MAEGIALLSVYGDEEDEDVEEDELVQEAQKDEPEGGDGRADEDRPAEAGHPSDSAGLGGADNGHEGGVSSPHASAQPVGKDAAEVKSLTPSRSPLLDRISKGRSPLVTTSGGVTGAASPGPIEAEGTGGLENGEERQSGEVESVTRDVEDDMGGFLPPPVEEKCKPELQAKFAGWLRLLREKGVSFNDRLRQSKDYRNPDLMVKMVEYQGIDEVGSCFPKEIFDPHGFPEEDFYDKLAVWTSVASEQRRQADLKEQERQKSGRVDFVRSGSLPGQVLGSGLCPDGRPKPVVAILPGTKGVSTPPLGSLPPAPPLPPGVGPPSTAKEGAPRPAKKSKWDKVDPQVDNPPAPSLPPVAKPPDTSTRERSDSTLRDRLGARVTTSGGYASDPQGKRREVDSRSSSRDRKRTPP